MPNVSVIIPVYNVEDYLRRCIDSILCQSLKEIEIILIDDGSNDRCGKICDEYAIIDNRIQVFHQDNKGLAAARNKGIAVSTAPFIMFIDSDDWVRSDFCERPYVEAIRNEADLIIFQAGYVKKGRIRSNRKQVPTGIVDAETAVQYGRNNVWNKLYKRELFLSVQYPEGRVFEDVAVTHKIVFLAKRIIMLPDILYFRVFRKNSISHYNSTEYKRDGFISALNRSEDLKSYGCPPMLYMPALWNYSLTYLATAKPSEDQFYQRAEKVVDSIKGIPSCLDWKKRILLMIWRINKRLFHYICKVMKQKDEADNNDQP